MMFSVIIPYYKKRKYIERCIESVLNQTFTDFEIIIVDDGSNDDIADLCNDKYEKLIKLISQSNQGVSAARNGGIANAKYEYIAFLDADDCWSISYLENVRHVIENEGVVKIVGSNYVRTLSQLDHSNNQVQYKIITDYFGKQIFKNTLFTSSSTIIHSSFFSNNLGFNSKLKKGEDLDVWFRTIASDGKVAYIENNGVFYSEEDTEQVTKTSGTLEDSILYYYKELYQDLIATNAVFRKSISKFIYLNLYPYYFSEQNHNSSKLVLKNIPSKLVLMKLVYFLPVSWGIKILKTTNGKLRIRQYLKFVAQHLS